MREVAVKIFTFPELSETAKQKAKQDHAAACGYNWADEALESLKALAKHFGGRLSRYEIDYFNCSHSSARFDMPEMEADEIRELLAELGTYNPDTLKGNGDCKLTGVCFDEDAIDGFRAAFMRDGETDLDKLMAAAFYSWLGSVQSDCEYQFSDEAFAENCEANGYEFTEGGELYR